MWQKFIEGFCKVEFLCHGTEPNWLGWVAIFFGGMSVLGLLIVVLVADHEARRR